MDQKYWRNSELIMKRELIFSLPCSSLQAEKWVTRSGKREKLLAAFLAGFPFPVLCLRKIYHRFLEDDAVCGNASGRCTGNYCLHSRIEALSLFVESHFPPEISSQIANEPTDSLSTIHSRQRSYHVDIRMANRKILLLFGYVISAKTESFFFRNATSQETMLSLTHNILENISAIVCRT